MTWGKGWIFGDMWGMPDFWGFVGFFAILDLVLKSFALWKSAQRKQQVWFIALLIINSAGILPAIYLVMHKDFASPKKSSKKKK
jgi:formate hydrogenlyase subunit 3/multisubunit Na+/H+ antiporter MnhD subunit